VSQKEIKKLNIPGKKKELVYLTYFSRWKSYPFGWFVKGIKKDDKRRAIS